MLPGYSLIEKLHESDETVIHRALRVADRRVVIHKSPRGEHPSPRVLTRLQHEYNLLRELDIPGVIHVYGLEQSGDSLTLVEEDFGGQPLDELLRAGPVDRALALKIAVALAGTLAAVHAVPIVHRDIKPANILVRPVTGEVQLIDFSLATRLSRESRRPEAPTSLAGTLAYMAPEQTGRMNRVVDTRSDLYALGVTLYELLTGALPFPETDALELIHSLVTRTPVAPHVRDPAIPRALSDIVMRLLEKAAEARYQTARGLHADLERCLEEWRARGDIAAFAPGGRDQDGQLRLPQRLYGRADAAATLLTALARARGGAAELVLIAGHAGIGKSALIEEIFKGSVRREAAFVSGKFDQLGRHVPYASIAQALRQLMRELLGEPPARLEARRVALLAALGPNAQLLIDLIPELGLILGPQPEPARLGPSEARNRFNLVFQDFMRALATAEQPLVLFLDDLQWGDPASLTLLETLLTDAGAGYLLVVGAYREQEVDAGHPLTATLNALRRADAPMTELALHPLAQPDVEDVLADTLARPVAEVAPLAREVLAKTHGNPFFINQFLGALVTDGLLGFDVDAGAWRWDLRGIAAAQVTRNVVEFMASKLRDLDADTQRLLTLGAGIGHEFALGTLAALGERSELETAASLWPAIQSGLVLPIAGDYHHLLSDAAASTARSRPARPASHVRLRFLHDRVQQAAYSLIAADELPRMHLNIGRRLLAEGGRDGLFDVVNHLNIGVALISDPDQRRELAQLDLDAARRAKAATAYATAAGYAQVGLQALGPDPWIVDHALVFALSSERAECEYLSGQVQAAEALFDTLVARARTPEEHAEVQARRVVLYTTLGRPVDAMTAGRAGLRALGVDLADDEAGWGAALGAEMADLAALRAGRSVEALIEGPPLADPRMDLVIRLLIDMAMSAFYVSPLLWSLLIARSLTITLRHGHSKQTPYGFLAHGFGLANQGQAVEACAFGRLGLAVHERYHDSALTCQMYAVFGVYHYMCNPLRESIPLLRRAIQSGLETGDTTYTSMATNILSTSRLGLGDELGAVAEEIDRFHALMQRIHDRLTIPLLTITRQAIRCLTGRTRGPYTFDDEHFDEVAFLAESPGPSAMQREYYYHVARTQVLYLHGDFAGALAMAGRAEALGNGTLAVYYSAELPFYALLVRSAAFPAATPAAREELLAAMERNLERIAALAVDCPANFEHQRLLGAAELARRRGRDDEAVGLYERAIAGAQAQGFPHIVAIASELAADLHRARRRPGLANFYLREAHHLFVRWGASVKAGLLAARHPELASATSERRVADVTTTTTARHADIAVDVAAALRAAQTLAGERALGNVVELLMRGVLQAAGAQRGCLLVPEDGGLVLAAATDAGGPRAAVELGRPLTADTPVLAAVVHFVARTRETVVVADATADLRFAGEPYVVRTRPRSVLCLALQHQGRTTAILYLENNAVTHAFTAERVELLKLLAAQAATAMENARLYTELEQSAAAVRRANEELEAEVGERTAELRRVNGQLQAELVERQRAVQQREALQQEVIAAQRARLAEMSTPLMPITDSVVAMPLIGTMDAERAQQVLETALTGAQRHRARVVILDVTGMQQHDPQIAHALITTAGALRLLGAQAVLTGVGPAFAELLAGLGVDLRGLVTCGTLQAGIAHALARTRRTVGSRSP